MFTEKNSIVYQSYDILSENMQEVFLTSKNLLVAFFNYDDAPIINISFKLQARKVAPKSIFDSFELKD